MSTYALNSARLERRISVANWRCTINWCGSGLIRFHPPLSGQEWKGVKDWYYGRETEKVISKVIECRSKSVITLSSHLFRLCISLKLKEISLSSVSLLEFELLKLSQTPSHYEYTIRSFRFLLQSTDKLVLQWISSVFNISATNYRINWYDM